MTIHEFDFEETDEAFRLLEAKEDDIIKPLINFELVAPSRGIDSAVVG